MNCSESTERDCAVCLQKCNYPTQLPCGHIFCFLCVKGVAIQSKKCAMCRAEIPSDYLDHPIVLDSVTDKQQTSAPTEGYQWYYEGRNGWWKYDERSNIDLETAFNAGQTECKLLLAGALYTINLQNMVQVQNRDRTRRRRVKRDTPTLPAKGIAGIKISNIDETKTDNITSPSNSSEEVIEILDDDQPTVDHNAQTTNRDVHELIHSISSMDLTENQQADTPTAEEL